MDVSPNQRTTEYDRLDLDENGSPKAAQLLERDLDGNRETTNSLGDMNCDGAFDAADIAPFRLAIGGCEAYMQQYPNCDCLRADMNGDNTADGADIDAFLALLGSRDRAVPHLTYVWDAENRLKEVRPAGGAVTESAGEP